jgi:hypothetical protein
VFLVHAVVLLARARKSRMLDHALVVMYGGDRPSRPVPDYAVDRHTARGARMGRDMQHFLDEGAQLENEAELDDPYAEEAWAVLARPKPKPPGGQLQL